MKEEEFLKNNFGKIVWESHGMFYRFEPKELPIKYQPKTHLNTTFNQNRLTDWQIRWSYGEIIKR